MSNAERIAEIRSAATAAARAGISVVPPLEDGTKRPLGSWKRYQDQPATKAELERWYGVRTGVGFVCGAVSGGLELLELDSDFYAEFKATAEGVGLGPLLERIEGGYLERSPGGGWHLLYFCSEIRGNTKLARRPGPADEQGRPSVEVLIETRGEGGYVVVAPSNGRVHPSGGRYELLRGGPATIATITDAERDQLWGLARSFDRMPSERVAPEPKASPKRESQGARPGDDFNARVNWESVLSSHGWKALYTRGDTTYWRRPGKQEGWSATTNHNGSGLLWVFTSSSVFEQERSYTKFGAYALLNHGGDFTLATRSLGQQGYGEPTRPKAAPRAKPVPQAEPTPGPGAGEPPTTLAFPRVGDQPDRGSAFANYHEVMVKAKGNPDKEESVKVADRVDVLDCKLAKIAGDWPKRVGGTLFFEAADHRPVYLRTAGQFFAWIDPQAHVDWTKGAKFITQDRFFEHRRMTAGRFEAIDTLPHWPPIPGVFYMHPEIPAATGKLGELVDFFKPATDEDRELILAMILTFFWGGTPGNRPAFLVTGPDNDPELGRGVGKTRMPLILAQGLTNGIIDVSPTDQIATVKTRLLSEGGDGKRVAVLDNIKTLRFSWADLEGLITNPVVSGRALYVGEACQPNLLVWILTLNGASLSKDMAQRVIVIKLARPVYRKAWEEDVRAFMQEHRLAILGEIRSILESEPGPLVPKSRWASWESAVLSKVNRAESCQRLIAERQSTVDDDNEERDLVADRFRDELHRCCHTDPDSLHAFVRSETAARWLNRALNKNIATNQASSYLRGLGIPELRKSKSAGVLGWFWHGVGANPRAETVKVLDPQDTVPARPDDPSALF